MTKQPWREKVRDLLSEVQALQLAIRDPHTPWYAKALAALVIAYALSPIDLIPDFIPVVGHLDDVVLIPLGLATVRRLIPETVLSECRARASAESRTGGKGRWIMATIIVLLWLLLAWVVATAVF